MFEQDGKDYYIDKLEQEKADLQLKLEVARVCDLPTTCCACINRDCINNIYYSLKNK